MGDLVETFFKGPRKPSRQKQRRARWEAEKRAGYRVVDIRSGGQCEVDGCRNRATSHHHKAGRVGPDVNHPSLLLHVCVECDLRITTEPEWAKANGYSVDRVPRPSSKTVLRVVRDE